MDILNTYTLGSNKQIKINFAGGDLSSDAGLLLIKEFAAKIGLVDLVKNSIKLIIMIAYVFTRMLIM